MRRRQGFLCFFKIVNFFLNAIILKEGSTFLKKNKECQNKHTEYIQYAYTFLHNGSYYRVVYTRFLSDGFCSNFKRW